MKVLILYCSTGGGHQASATALRTAFEKSGIECCDEDFVSLVLRRLSHADSFIYLLLVRCRLFDLTYRLSAWLCGMSRRHFGGHLKSPTYALFSVFTGRLLRAITEGGYDAVVTTHLFAAMTLTSLRCRHQLEMPSVLVTTDFTCYPFVFQTKCDAYIIPHRLLTGLFTSMGLPSEKLHPFGIPVDVDLLTSRMTRAQARAIFLRTFRTGKGGADSSEGSRWFLIMGGSMGYGPIEELVEGLLQRIGRNDRIICLCDGNTKLASSLRRKHAGKTNLDVLEHTDQVPVLMRASDVLFSKPGGVSSYEAALRNLPLVHTRPISEIERSNAVFFRNHGMSFYSTDIQEQIRHALKVCHDHSMRESMLRAQHEHTNPDVCRQTVELVMALHSQWRRLRS